MKFSLIIPIYNEEKGITNTILHLNEYKKSWNDDFEIILVNDGSSDKTIEILNSMELDFQYKVVEHSRNLGYGAALKTGIRNASSEIIVITDADETYPNERIPELVETLISEKRDMVVGARIGDNVEIPLIRRPAKKAINMLANYLTGVKIPDLNSGLRVMKKDIINKFVHILPNGFSFTTTITLSMLTNGYDLKYVKIDYFHRAGSSKIRPFRDTLNFLQLIVRTTVYYDPLKVFIPISLTLFIMAIALFLYRIIFGGAFSVTSTVLFITSIQFLLTGMIADLIDKRTGK